VHQDVKPCQADAFLQREEDFASEVCVLQRAMVSGDGYAERSCDGGEIVGAEPGQKQGGELERVDEPIPDRDTLPCKLGDVQVDALANDWIVAQEVAEVQGNLVKRGGIGEGGVVDAGQHADDVGHRPAGGDQRAPLLEYTLLVEADRRDFDDARSGRAGLDQLEVKRDVGGRGSAFLARDEGGRSG